MRIAVCYKAVPDSQQIKENGKDLVLDGAGLEIGQYDLNAIEAAVSLACQVPDSRVIAITAAGKAGEDSKIRKGVLSRGPDELVAVIGEGLDTADAFTTASTLKNAIEKVGDIDLVIFGEGSGDNYSQQTGPLVGTMLGWTTVNAVGSIESFDGRLTVRRDLETVSETIKLTLPAVISVTSDINVPRIPSLKQIMQAGKKPVTVLPSDEVYSGDAALTIESVHAPGHVARRQEIFNGISEETADEICALLRRFM